MTPAWAWVLGKRATIERLVRKYSSGLDSADLHQEVLILLVDKWSDYEPRLSPSGYSWILWQVRLARIRMLRKQREVLSGSPEYADVEDTSDTNIYRYLRIKEIFALATPKQREAMLTVLRDETGESLNQYGMTSRTRNMRLYKLRKRIGVT